MTDNERLINRLVEQAYGRLAEGEGLEPGDKVIAVLSRNNDNVLKLIRKVSCANGKPITMWDKAKASAWPTATILSLTALLWMVLEKLG